MKTKILEADPNMYVLKDALDKEIKPLILRWLASLVDIEFAGDWRDQWIIWNIWDGELTICIDERVAPQKTVFNKLPIERKGTRQKGTGKLVNEKWLYFKLDDIISIEKPDITGNKLLNTIRHIDNDGDDFYEYYWQVFLSDGTSIQYRNQKDQMDLKVGDFIYDATIQQRAFVNFLRSHLLI